MGRVLKPKKETFLGRSVCRMFSATQWAQSSVNLCHEKEIFKGGLLFVYLVIINNAQKNIFMMFLQARLEAFGTHHRFVLKCWILYFQEYMYLTFENGMYKKHKISSILFSHSPTCIRGQCVVFLSKTMAPLSTKFLRQSAPRCINCPSVLWQIDFYKPHNISCQPDKSYTFDNRP